MIRRVLLSALAVAIFLGAAAYTVGILNEKSLRVAEVGPDACYARYGIGLLGAPSVPDNVRIDCTRPIRDYEAGQFWRFLIAAAVGATGAFLVVGGIVIVVRQRRRQPGTL